MVQLTIVIPCFNERSNVERFPEELFPPLFALKASVEVVSVDDGSIDGTRQALEALAGRFPIEIAVHDRNQGLGAALRTGFERARGEWIATLDADLTFAPAQLAALLERQKQTDADLIGGSPFLTRDGCAGVPLRRRLPSLMLNAFYRGLFSPRLTAYTPIFRLYRADKLKRLELTSAGFEINAEIAARFIQAGWKLAETPAVLTTRTSGESKLSSWRELSRHVRLIGRLLLAKTGGAQRH